MINALIELAKVVLMDDVIKTTILWRTILEELKSQNGAYLERCIKKVAHYGIDEHHYCIIAACYMWITSQRAVKETMANCLICKGVVV